MAAASFIAKDMGPFIAIEGQGLFNLLTETMNFGKSYPKATAEDLQSRNTIKTAVGVIAADNKIKIAKLLDAAKALGNIAVTSDTWTDNIRRLKYICLVAYLTC